MPLRKYKGLSLRNKIFWGFLFICGLSILGSTILSFFVLRDNSINQIMKDQHKKVDEVLEYLDGESANRWGLWKEKADMLDQGASNAFEEAYWMVKKALRGDE